MKVKNIILAIMVVIFAVNLFWLASYMDTHYDRKGFVTNIENESIITIQDESGNVWEWEKEDNESFKLNDNVVMKMNNNNTTTKVKDDIIERIIKL